MKKLISSFFVLKQFNALILFVLFWLPFVEYTPDVMIAYFSLGLSLILINNYSKLSLYHVRYPYLILGLYFLYNSTGTWKGIETGIGFLGMLAITKIFSLRNKSDYFLYFLILQLFLCAQLLSSESLYLALYLILLCPVLFLFMHFSVKSQNEDKVFSKERRKIITQLFLCSVPISIVLFFVFPRLQLGNFFFSTNLNIAQSGYVEKLSPGEISKLVNSNEVKFRSRFFGTNPLSSTLYWKGAILSKGNGFSWEKGSRLSRRHISKTKLKARYEVEYDKLEKGALFTLDGTTNVKSLSKASIMSFDGDVYQMVPHSNQKIRYQGFKSSIKKSKKKYSEKQLKTYLEVSSSSSRLTSFSKALREDDKSTNKNVVSRLIKYFQDQNFQYSLSPGEYDLESGVSDFVFDRRIGFCEHYAGASATILRLANVPSRVVVGFQGGEFSPLGKYFIIRSRDAHAWVEFWSETESKWLRFDPVQYVASGRISFGSAGYLETLGLGKDESILSYLERQKSGYLNQLLLSYDFAYYRLNSMFLSYNLDKQLSFFKDLGVHAKNGGTLFLYALGLIIPLLTLFSILRKVSYLKISKVDKVILPLLKKLEKEGHIRSDSESVANYLRRVDVDGSCGLLADYYEIMMYSQSKDKESIVLFKKAIKNKLK